MCWIGSYRVLCSSINRYIYIYIYKQYIPVVGLVAGKIYKRNQKEFLYIVLEYKWYI